MEIEIQRKAKTQLSDSLQVEVYAKGTSYSVRIITYHSVIALSIDEWKEVNSTIVLSLDKLGRS